MLVFDPNKRITIEEALHSPYFKLWENTGDNKGRAGSSPDLMEVEHTVQPFSLDYENGVVTLEGFRGTCFFSPFFHL